MTRRYEQLCPVASALDVLGGRWTLPLLRDLLWHGPQRFNELLEPNPGLSSALLSRRLARLVDQGLVERIPAGASATPHYRLTPKGQLVEPVIAALYGFGAPLLAEATLNHAMVAYNIRRAAIDHPGPLWEITDTVAASVVVDEVRVDCVAGPGTLRLVSDPDYQPALVMRMRSAAFVDLVAGRSTVSAALEAGTIQIDGDQVLAQRILEVLQPVATARLPLRRSPSVALGRPNRDQLPVA